MYVMIRGARGSVMVKALCCKPEGRGFRDSCGEFFPPFPIYLIVPAALGPGVHSACNRNCYQEQKYNVFGTKVWPVRRADNLAAISEPIVYTIWDP
jgi:hypothetical protein